MRGRPSSYRYRSRDALGSAQEQNQALADSPGFLRGLWHGLIILFTFVISLFTDDVTVYEVANDGNWYDFGFFLGLLISLGGMGAGSRRRKKRR